MPLRRPMRAVSVAGVLTLAACTGNDVEPQAAGTSSQLPAPEEPGATLDLAADEVHRMTLTDGVYQHLEPSGRLEAVFANATGGKLVLRGPPPEEGDAGGYTVAIEVGSEVALPFGENRRFLANDQECTVSLEEGPDSITGSLDCGRLPGIRGATLAGARGAFRAVSRGAP